MNISGVLVRSRPENIDAVWKSLEQREGVEVHGANPDGRLVVTVEETSDQGMADAVASLQEQPGVIAVSMIYHEFEKNGNGTREGAASESTADAHSLHHPSSQSAHSSVSQEAQS